MEPRIEISPEKKLVGMRSNMSLAQHDPARLWRAFMPRRHEIRSRIGQHLISLRRLDDSDAHPMSLEATFDRWAAVEVELLQDVPDSMESYILAGGMYAIFPHTGPAAAAPGTFAHIFNVWLPRSEYELDARDLFEVLEEGYRPDDPAAREEIWIPVRRRRLRATGQATG